MSLFFSADVHAHRLVDRDPNLLLQSIKRRIRATGREKSMTCFLKVCFLQLALACSSVRGLCLRYGNRRQRSKSTNNQSQHQCVSTGSWTAISEYVPTKTADQVRSVTSRLTNSCSIGMSNCRCLAARAEAFH